jgi:hypothetical protein
MKEQPPINYRYITGQNQIPEPNHPNPDYPYTEDRHAFFTPPGTQSIKDEYIIIPFNNNDQRRIKCRSLVPLVCNVVSREANAH